MHCQVEDWFSKIYRTTVLVNQRLKLSSADHVYGDVYSSPRGPKVFLSVCCSEVSVVRFREVIVVTSV